MYIITLLLGAAVDYIVTITTLPLEGPIPPHQQTALHCSIQPVPQEAVNYYWMTTAPKHRVNHETDTSPVGFYQPSFTHPRYANLFCHVITAIDERTLGIGNILLEIQGIIIIIGNVMFIATNLEYN